MALTRKMLKAMGIEDDQAEQIIEAHAETVSALKKQRDDAQAKADGVPELEKQLEAAKKAAEAAAADDTGAKLKAVQDEFAAYKAQVAANEAKATARALIEQKLKDKAIDPDFMRFAVSDIDFSGLEVANGAFVDDEAASKLVSDFAESNPRIFTNNTQKGADPGHPPAATGGKAEPMSLAGALRQRYESKE